MNIIALPESTAWEQAVEEAAAKNRDARYEVVNGQYVELPPMSTSAALIATRLVVELSLYLRDHQLGQVIGQSLFPIAKGGKTRRRPDVAYVSFSRWPKGRPLPHTDTWPVVPELAVEVVSPTDLAEDLLLKLAEYFHAGVVQAWVIYPKLSLLQVYQSLTKISGLTGADELDCGDLLPGFRLQLAPLFEGFSEDDTPPA